MTENQKKLTKMRTLKLFTLLLIVFSFTSCYDFQRKQNELNVESQGRSILLEAESSKKAMIEEAKAENESATLRAEAQVKIAKAEAQSEIERAKGVAEANRIIGESLKNNETYLKYLLVNGLVNGKGERIYIPTEAGLPILEANR